MLGKLATMWTQPSTIGPVIFSEPFNPSNKPLDFDGMLSKITKETKAAENKVKRVRSVTVNFRPEENGQKTDKNVQHK